MSKRLLRPPQDMRTFAVSSSSSQIDSRSRRERQPGPTAMFFKTAIIKLATELSQLKTANPEHKSGQ